MRIKIEPDDFGTQPDSTVAFAATGYDAYDNVVALIDPTWECTGGPLTPNGNVCELVAADPGNHSISCTDVGIEGTATFWIMGPLQDITVATASTNLYVGNQVLFSAKGLDQWNNPVPIAPVWTATGGTIVPGGGKMTKGFLVDSVTAVYTVLEVGNHIMVCTDSLFGIADTAHIVVSEDTSGIYEYRGRNAFYLFQNSPNPFSAETTISFSLRADCYVTLKVFDRWGREIAVLADSQFMPGLHEMIFDGRGLPAGLYFYTIRINGFGDIGKMILMK